MHRPTSDLTTPPQSSDWPPEGLEKISNCPVCGSSARHILYEGLTDRVFFCVPGHWTMHQCNTCHTAYLDPRPTPQTIHLAYETYYTHSKRQPARTNRSRSLSWLIHAVINDYLNSRYGSKFRPAAPLGSVGVRLLPKTRRKLDRKHRYLPKLRPGVHLLDVGFGDGAFLDLAKRVGWEVSGVDPDPLTIDSARRRGLNVHLGNIEEFGNQYEVFDAITLNHVIEHVHDPKKTLKRAYDLLKPGGCLYLETPNLDAAGHRIYGRHWRGLEPPRHLVLFTWSSLEKLALDVGFDRFFRLPQYQLYADLAAKSRALQTGSDPYEKGIIRATDHFRGFIFGLVTRLNNKYSEFITLTCHK